MERASASNHRAVNTSPTPFEVDVSGAMNGVEVRASIVGSLCAAELRFDARRPAAPDPLVGDLSLLALASLDVPLLHAVSDPDPGCYEAFRAEAKSCGHAYLCVGPSGAVLADKSPSSQL